MRLTFAYIFILAAFVQPAFGQDHWEPFDLDAHDSNTSSTPPWCLDNIPVLEHDSLGPFHPGQTVTEIESICNTLAYEWSLGAEAFETPYAAILIEGTRVHFDFDGTSSSSKVIYIRILGPEIRTKEEFRLSTNIFDVINEWGKPSFGQNECHLFVWFDSHPGISFGLDTPSNFGCIEMSKIKQSEDIDLLPESSTISSTFLYKVN